MRFGALLLVAMVTAFDAPYTFHFPADHAAHPGYPVEWWYYTGELASGTRQYGFELTFFRVEMDSAWQSSRSRWAPRELILAHAALTGETNRRFGYDERASRTALGLAGADSSRYRVWVGDWSAALEADGRTHHLAATSPRFALDLDLVASRPPAIHGRHGVSRKGEGPGAASHYVSITRLAARGRIVDGRDTLAVMGEAWMDHEFGGGRLGVGEVGWDWFGLRLADGRDLMLYSLRMADGSIAPASGGSIVRPDGGVVPLARDECLVETTDRWRSPHTGAQYPSGWRVRVPAHGIDMLVRPTIPDQELVTRSTGGVTYWEGSVRVSSAAPPHAEAGRGYVELTGYAGRPPGR
jgi:predicted secreted hydrolase